jgi:hypothetical protein
MHGCVRNSAISCLNVIDIQKQYNILSNEKQHDSLVDLASAIIDPSNAGMKDGIDKHHWHKIYEERLSPQQLLYVTKDAYTSYDMYMQIIDMKTCLLPLDLEVSHRSSCNTGKCAKKS